MDKLIDSICNHEGFKEKPYMDPLVKKRIPKDELEVIEKWMPKLTLTFGHGLTFIKEAESKYVVKQRIVDIHAELGKIRQVYYTLPDAIKDVLIEMAYQMGVMGVDKFDNMWRALTFGDYASAAEHMLDSKWAKQTAGRANELASIVRGYHDR